SFFRAAIPVSNDIVHVADNDGVVREIEQTRVFPQDALSAHALVNLLPELFVARTELRSPLLNLLLQLVPRALQGVLGASTRATPGANDQGAKKKDGKMEEIAKTK